MAYVLTLAEGLAAGPSKVGGKGWNMGRLLHFGFRIPKGCLISVDTYWQFLNENQLVPLLSELKSLSANEAADEESANRLADIRCAITAGQLPTGLMAELFSALGQEGITAATPLAVRSSATAEDSAAASFAGIHRSFLNVIGHNAVAIAIKNCYASLWTPTALVYRRKMGISDCEAGLAVVVQQLIPSLYSGVAFSADPVTGRRDRVVVSASFGLGEAVVAGSVEADEYHLHIDHTGPVKLVGGRIGLKHHAIRPGIDGGTVTEELGYAERSEPVLAKPQLEELTRVVRRIQDTLGDGVQPQDVEWCYDGFYLTVTQSRPITALPEATFPELAGQQTIWSNANLKDAAPGVLSPLGWWFNSLTVEVLLRQLFLRGGYVLPVGLNWSRLHNGRLYMNLSALQWAAYDAFGWTPSMTNRALGGHQPEIRVPPAAPLWSTLGRARLRRMTRMGMLLRRASRTAEKSFAQIWHWCAEFEKEPFSQHFHELGFLHRLWAVEKQRRQFLPTTMIHNVGGLWSTRLAELLERKIPGRGDSLTSALLAGTDSITSAEQGYRLVTIAQQAAKEESALSYFTNVKFQPTQWRQALQGTTTAKLLDQFLRQFGHRGVYEMEIMNARWSEDPTFLLETIKSYLLEPVPEADPLQVAKEKRLAAELEVKQILGLSLAYPLYRFLVGKAKEAMRLREEAKSALVRLVRPARMAALAIGKRLTAKGTLQRPEDLFFLTGDEIASLLSAQWDGKGLQAILQHRMERRQALQAERAPDVIMGDRAVVRIHSHLELAGVQRKIEGRQASDAAAFLTGVAVSSGKASGQARKIDHPHEGKNLRRGEVLVAPSTDPAWTPLFLRASAVVMEVGGYLSHGAIVAREYGIPAVVNVSGAMAHFADGDLLHVDGDIGKVTRTQKGQTAAQS